MKIEERVEKRECFIKSIQREPFIELKHDARSERN